VGLDEVLWLLGGFFVNVDSSNVRISSSDLLLKLAGDFVCPFNAEVRIKMTLQNQMCGVAEPANLDVADIFDFWETFSDMLNVRF
jgi:hypothetical protein